MFWNVKCKIYPDGSTNTIYCNQRIFNDTPTVRKPKSDDDEQTKSDDKSNENPLPLRKKVKVGGDLEVREDSLKRAKDKIQDIVLCNNFDYFVTLTFNPKKVDSYDVEEVKRVVKNWLNNGVKRRNFAYIAIPEYHKSGRIHIHALMSGNLQLEESGKCHNGKIIYNLSDWSDNYGFCTAIPVDGNIPALSYYITKYITKGNDKIFGRFYWSSKNLRREPDYDYKNVDFGTVYQYEYPVKGTTRILKYEADFKY